MKWLKASLSLSALFAAGGASAQNTAAEEWRNYPVPLLSLGERIAQRMSGAGDPLLCRRG